MTSVRFPIVTAQECLNLKQIVEVEERTRERFLRAVDTVTHQGGQSSPSLPSRSQASDAAGGASTIQKKSSGTPTPSTVSSHRSTGSRRKDVATPAMAQPTANVGPAPSESGSKPVVAQDQLPAPSAVVSGSKAASQVGSQVGAASRVTGSVFSRGSSSVLTNPSSRLPASQASKLRAIGQRLSRLEETVDQG